MICHAYNSFQKDPIDRLTKYFSEIIVIVRYNPIANISNYVPINFLSRFTLDVKIDLKNKPDNLNVYLSPVYYGPFDFQYKKVGRKHLKSVQKIIDRNDIKFDFILTQFLWSSGYVGAKLKEKYNVPFIAIGHGYDVYDLPFRNSSFRNTINYVLKSANAVITVSKKNKQLLEMINGQIKIDVIHNGFNRNYFHPMDKTECRKKLSLPLNKQIILNIGNLVEVKGQKYLVEAIDKVRNEINGVYCVIVGEGTLKKDLNKQIKLLNLENHIKLVGSKPHHQIPLWINSCDLFILSSVNEGNPTVMFESLGCGKPFVGTNVGGIPEIITSSDYGYYIDKKNPGELAKIIKMCFNKKWDKEKILTYSKNFMWDSISKQILSHFSDL